MERILPVMLVVAGSIALAVAVHSAEPQSSVPIEYQVKAAFLYRFIHFIEWPESVAPREEGAVIIGVIGKGPMHAALVAMAADEKHGRRLVIKRFEDPRDIASCHIVFISASEHGRSREILNRLRDQSTLTVGEFEGFADRGGMINFVIVDKVVRFQMNPEAAKKAKLTVSSKLLRLAEIVGAKE